MFTGDNILSSEIHATIKISNAALDLLCPSNLRESIPGHKGVEDFTISYVSFTGEENPGRTVNMTQQMETKYNVPIIGQQYLFSSVDYAGLSMVG